MAEQVQTGHKCPDCGSELVLKQGRRGPFYSCPNQLYDLSMIKLLSSRFGILKNGKNTFKTGSINTKKITSFF